MFRRDCTRSSRGVMEDSPGDEQLPARNYTYDSLEIGNEEDEVEDHDHGHGHDHDHAHDHDSENQQSTPSSEDWRKAIRNWTLLYGISLAVLILILNSAAGITLLMHKLAFVMVTSVCGVLFRHPAKAKSIGTIYGLGLSLLLLWKPIQSDLYAGTFHLVKPCRPFQDLLHQLRYDNQLSPDMKYDQRHRPFQALGLGNGYARQLGEALQTHFERYSRNETQRFEYVEDLNLIGNVFDDRGADFIIDTLYHPYSYTSKLLLGRNKNLGDSTAIQLANLISSASNKKDTSSGKTGKGEISQAPIGQPLVWLEYGGTWVTETGLEKLYEAMGTRSFEFLELEYTDRRFQAQHWYRPNPIPPSVRHLHKAKYIQEIEFTGNSLNDNDMSILVGEVLQTNISSVNLMNNKIGTRGVIHLLPLTNKIQTLDLAMNWRIGDQGAILLAKALNNTNTTVEHLSLFKCGVGQKGADAFLSIFPHNQRLKGVSLTLSNGDYGGIDKETIQALRMATRENWKA